MRKIFSTVLVATALLFSMQANAANVAKIGTKEYATLQDAVNAVPRLATQSTPTTIELLDNVNLSAAVSVFDRNVTIDLKGKTIYGSTTAADSYNKVVFALISGTLKITGTGNVTAADAKGEAVRLFGSANPAAENYSNLIVDKDVVMRGQKAVQVYTWGGGYLNGASDWSSIVDFEDGYAGNKPRTAATSNDVDTWFAGLSEAERTILKTASNKLQSFCLNNGHYGFAFGVNITINGTLLGKEYAIQTSGVLRSTPKTKPVFASAKYPVITINEGATLQGLGNGGVQYDGSYPTGIYAAGYAYWKVYGDVSGDNGIVAKSGDIVVDGNANISASGAFVGSTSSKITGSGTDGSGSAIDIVSDNAYSGNMTVTIGGSSVVSSKNGYAVFEEVAISSTTETKTTGVTITGGTFSSETNSAVKTTEGVQEQIVAKGTITGGTYSSDDIDDYLPAVSGLITIEVDNESGATVYVIGGTKEEVTWKNENINTVADGSYVQYKEAPVDYTLTKDVNIAYLSMADADYTAKITIPAGKTMNVGEIVMGANAQIVVEAGGKLVVNSTNGLIAFDVNNLIIKADATNGMGTFVLNPAVKGNKTPWATVEYMTSPYCGKEVTTIGASEIIDYHWEVLASPFVQLDSINSVATYFSRVVDGVFVTCSRADVVAENQPFGMFAMCPNTTQAATKYTFYGKLQGANSLNNFSVKKDFNYMGNAYTGKLNAKEMVLELQQSASDVRSLVYVWNVKDIRWDVYNGYRLSELGNVNPMAAFVLYSDADGTVNLNYEKLIWNTNK